MASELIAEAITDYFGERCLDYAEGCPTCEAWAEYDRWNTRPAPAATDTGLETVGVQYAHEHSITGRAMWGWQKEWKGCSAIGTRELVTRSQAEAIIAAERARADANFDKVIEQSARAERAELKERWLTEMVTNIISNPIGSVQHFRAVEDARLALGNPEVALSENEKLIQRAQKLEADNAAKDARIKELDRCHEGTIDLCNQKTAQIEALEAKLAAAEKALEFYRDGFKYHPKRTSTGINISEWKPTPELLDDCGETARAVLGGKPSC